MNIIEHHEKYVGVIEKGWKDDKCKDVQVVSFSDTPCESISTVATIGLSKHNLEINKYKKIRQELILIINSKELTHNIISLLFYVCECVLSHHTPILKGDIIPLSNISIEKINFAGLYCTSPIYFSENFEVLEDSELNTIVVWLIPIFKNEIEYIKKYGCDLFEELLEKVDPELWSLDRKSVLD